MMKRAREANMNCHLVTVILLMVPACIQCFVLPNMKSSTFSAYNTYLPTKKSRTTRRSSQLAGKKTRDDAGMLPLSTFDREKFRHMKTRGRVMPIIIMGEPIIPGQRLYFRSGDPKFENLVRYIAYMEQKSADGSSDSAEEIAVGIVSFDPQTKSVLQTGVMAPLDTGNFEYRLTASDGSQQKDITTSFKGTRMFQLISNPWMDPTGSFHMAHVQILDPRFDDEYIAQSGKLQYESDELYTQIPWLVDYWMQLMFAAGLATPASLRLSLRELEDVEGYQENPVDSRRRRNNYALYPPMCKMERAIWTVSLLNPIRRYPITVSNEIRPAFFSCLNDRDRLALCVSALRTSVGYLELYVEAKRRENNRKEGDDQDEVGT